jgi:hypothetical protein
MKKIKLFKKTQESLTRKLNNQFYIDIINNHNTTLMAIYFTSLELIILWTALRKTDSLSENEKSNKNNKL